jgi:WD40 repeat protein
MAEYLLPRWYGQLGDVEKFAAEAVQLLPGEDGLDVYGHIAYVMNQYDPNLLFWGQFDRELLSKAAEVLVKRYPGARNVVPFAALCAIAAQNHSVARRIRPAVTSSDAPRVPIWKNVSGLYFRWCTAEEVVSGQAEWLWGTPFLYGNMLFAPDSASIWSPSGFARGAVTRISLMTKRVEQAIPASGSRVERLAFDPEKQWLIGSLAGGNFQGWVRWDVANGSEALAHSTTKACRALAINPKRTQVVWAENKSVLTLDLSSGKEGPRIESSGTVESIRFAPDGSLLAVQSESITVWDAATGKQRFKLPSFQTSPRPKFACEQLVDFDEQGRIWAVAVAVGVNPVQRPLLRFSPDGKTSDMIISHLPGQASSVVLSPDRRLLAMVESHRDPGAPESIQVWDVQAGQMQKRLLSTTHHITSLAFSPDGKRLASSGHLGGVIKVWRIEEAVGKPTAGQISRSTSPVVIP